MANGKWQMQTCAIKGSAQTHPPTPGNTPSGPVIPLVSPGHAGHLSARAKKQPKSRAPRPRGPDSHGRGPHLHGRNPPPQGCGPAPRPRTPKKMVSARGPRPRNPEPRGRDPEPHGRGAPPRARPASRGRVWAPWQAHSRIWVGSSRSRAWAKSSRTSSSPSSPSSSPSESGACCGETERAADVRNRAARGCSAGDSLPRSTCRITPPAGTRRSGRPGAPDNTQNPARPRRCGPAGWRPTFNGM
jgi:hypothetical protein